jgi:hypothetical protein
MKWLTNRVDMMALIGEQNLAVIDDCENKWRAMAENDGDVIRIKLLDGRAAWCRLYPNGWVVVATAPWDDAFQADIVTYEDFFAVRPAKRPEWVTRHTLAKAVAKPDRKFLPEGWVFGRYATGVCVLAKGIASAEGHLIEVEFNDGGIEPARAHQDVAWFPISEERWAGCEYLWGNNDVEFSTYIVIRARLGYAQKQAMGTLQVGRKPKAGRKGAPDAENPPAPLPAPFPRPLSLMGRKPKWMSFAARATMMRPFKACSISGVKTKKTGDRKIGC